MDCENMRFICQKCGEEIKTRGFYFISEDELKEDISKHVCV